MIRQPSSASQLYAWWREALTNPDMPRSDGLPECGWFKVRLVKGGPWVAARIWCERDIDPNTLELIAPERLACEVGGERAEPSRHWLHMAAISREEFEWLDGVRMTDPTMAATHATVTLSEMEPVTP